MSETPRDQRALWREVSRTFEEFGEALRVHLSPDAARTPSDPTTPDPTAASDPGPTSWDRASGSPRQGPAPWADPAAGSPGRPGEGAGAADSDWIAATPAADPDSPSPSRRAASTRSDDPWAAATAADPSPTATGNTDATGTPPPATSTTGSTGPATSGPATSGSATGGSGTATSGADDSRTGGASGTATGGSATGSSGTGTSGTGTSGAETGGAGTGGAGDRERGWREWGGGAGGRFATQADWESARESVRELGSSARRIATQAGDAARDPHVRDSAQRAARSLGDAIVTTVEEFATDLRTRMRNPRWSDPSRPADRSPVAPIEDAPDDERT
jgi:hypothetical protein